MIASESMRGATVAVLGLGASGLAACRSLAAGGARIWAWDDAEGPRRTAAAGGIPIVCLDACNWSRCRRLVASPGIPQRHPRPHRLVRSARAARVEVAGDIELLVENQPGRTIVGITGTNGKSTTTALVAHLLRGAGQGVQVGGNIGLPALDLLPKPDDDLYVLELSSFQLELTNHLACRVAVILNISTDHLDRHGGMAGYVRAKRRILRNQQENDVAVVGVDDDWGRSIVHDLGRRGRAKVIPISAAGPLDGGMFVRDGRVFDATGGTPREIADCAASAALRGRHNWQNAAAAFAVVRALGLDLEMARQALPSFAGLPHRMEEVGRLGQIRFVNDSKATNVEAAARSLGCYDRVYWIAGGRPKQGGLAAIAPLLGRVRHAFLIGEAAEGFAEELHGRVPTTVSGDLETALLHAVAAARAEPAPDERVVLLAPACASFDQFTNFEARGDAFRRRVKALLDGEGHT